MAIGLVLIVIILSALYRRVSDVLLALLGLIVTVIWMAGLSVLVGPGYLGITGNFTQISVIVPIFLIGLGVDYGLQLTFRYREERADGLSPTRSSARALSTVGAALGLAAVTTTIGFMTNLASPLPPIRDYGLFASLGVLSGLVVFVLLVPSARTLLDSRSYRESDPRPTTGQPGSDPNWRNRSGVPSHGSAPRRSALATGPPAVRS